MDIDIKKINTLISTNHKSFLKKYKLGAEKILADNRLKCEMVNAKLRFILKEFISCGIINSYKEQLGVGGHISIRIYCNNNPNFVEIKTNGEKVCVIGENIEMTNGFLEKENGFVVDDVLNKNFNWLHFSEKLLEMIHLFIYNKRKIIEFHISNLFSDKKS